MMQSTSLGWAEEEITAIFGRAGSLTDRRAEGLTDGCWSGC